MSNLSFDGGEGLNDQEGVGEAQAWISFGVLLTLILLRLVTG